MFDFTVLYDPVYAILADTGAVITTNDNITVTVSAIDESAGLAMSEHNRGSGIGLAIALQTIKPTALVRMYELVGLGVAETQLNGGTIVLNAKTWKIVSHQLKPSHAGENTGEVLLILSEL